LLQWGPPARDVSSVPGPPIGRCCPPGGHAASAVPFTTGVRPGPVEAAPLSELTVAPVRSAWPRATSAPPLPVLAHLAGPFVRPREPEIESTPSRARAPFYSLVARAADRRAPTPPMPPSPSRARHPKPLVLELQHRSTKPHPSRFDAGPSALRRRLRVRVRCRPPSPIVPLLRAASRRRAEPPARLAEHRAGSCRDSPSCPSAICAPRASAPVSTSSRWFHRHHASLPLSCFPRTTLLIAVLSLDITERRRVVPWSGTPRRACCLLYRESAFMPTARLKPSPPRSVLRKHQGDPVLLQGWPPTAPRLSAHRQLKPSLAMVAKTPPIQAQPCLCPRTPTARLNASKVSFGMFQIVPSLMRAKLSQSTLMLFDCLLINGLSMPES
jgi:hypothetical protein